MFVFKSLFQEHNWVEILLPVTSPIFIACGCFIKQSYASVIHDTLTLTDITLQTLQIKIISLSATIVKPRYGWRGNYATVT